MTRSDHERIEQHPEYKLIVEFARGGPML